MGTVKDDLKVYHPIKTGETLYYSKVMYKNSEISLQVNKTTVNLNKEKEKAKLQIDDKTKEFIKELSKALIEITSENSEEFFGKEINVDDCETIYKEALVDDTLYCFYDDDTYFYESKKKQVKLDDLPTEFDGICLLKCSAIVYTKHSFFTRWEISQFKIKIPKENEEVFKLNEYMIKDLPEHETEYENGMSKKLTKISLF
jgi:hypothetical protein